MPRRSDGRAALVLLALALGAGPSFAQAPELRPGTAAGDDPAAFRVLLAPQLDTTLSSQMNGTLGESLAVLGQRVGRNALLAQFVCTETQARAKVADAELTLARQNLDAKRALQ